MHTFCLEEVAICMKLMFSIQTVAEHLASETTVSEKLSGQVIFFTYLP